MTSFEKPQGKPDAAPTMQTAPEPLGSLVPARHPASVTYERKRRKLWLGAAGGLLVALIAGAVYLQPWTSSPMPVAIEQMAMAPVTRVLAVNGRIAALHSVNLRLLVGGTLSHVAVSEGEQVHAGQALLRMDTAAQDAVLRQAVAALDAALVVQEQADAAYARSLVLGANVSAVALAADRRAAQSAMQEVVRMTALLEQAQVQLAHYTLRAPFAGTVVGMDAEIGQVADTGTILLTLADLETLIVETNVDETFASQIVIGQSAVLRLSGETETLTGEVRTVARRVDVATGGLAVKIGFDAPVSAPIGLTVTANIVVDRQDAALTVPRTALVTGGGDAAVFLKRDGVARLQLIAVIDWPAARLIVTDGLVAGDMVIVEPTDLRDGQPVRADIP